MVLQEQIVNLINNIRVGQFSVVQNEAHHTWKNHNF